MIQKFVDRFMARKEHMASLLSTAHPPSYHELVNFVVKYVMDEANAAGVEEVAFGSYQGTSVYVIPGKSERGFWGVCVDYGSCSHCDTLASIADYGTRKPPTPKQVGEYLDLALHIVQQVRAVDAQAERA
jgi:hypothetical protein